MPIPSGNLGRCFDARLAPDKTAIIDIRDWERPIELSYAAFDAECDALARGLLGQGLRGGDRVGILDRGLSRWAFLLVKGTEPAHRGSRTFNDLAGSRSPGQRPETCFTYPT